MERNILGFKIYETEQVADFLQGCLNNLFILSLYIIITLFLVKLTNKIVDKMFIHLLKVKSDNEYKKQVSTIKNLVKSLSSGLVVVIMVLNLLARYNIDIRPLLAAAGVVGVAVGFAARRFVEDIIMGIFIILEGQIRVGDVVTIDNFSGTVEKVTLKMVIIRNPNGHIHYIRNGLIGAVTNKTREYACPIIDIGVAYDADLDKVTDVMNSVAQRMYSDDKYRKYLLAEAQVAGVVNFLDSAITIRITFKTVPSQQWFIEREYKKLLKEAFDREGISIPFPQMDVHIIKGE